MNLASILASLTKFDKDARRIGLFTAACQKKAIELATGQPPVALKFAQESSAIVADWVQTSRKVSLSWLWSDPFKGHRERVREFARTWDLDPLFRQEMG